VSYLTKTETSLVIWVNVVTIVARSVRLLSAYMREDVHANHQLHCQWWFGQCHAKRAENVASVHNTCFDKIVCYLERIFNRNRKFKQQVSKLSTLKLDVCLKINACYIFVCIFFQICQNSNFFLKVVWERTEGMVGSIISTFVGNLLLFPAVKEFVKIR